ncbi:PREDICTED: collectin-10-like [Branchiostoma belcheri]|uniref:Collectin-10-like n=1 Tax=Branchiostoma belcheri TaxID=7741 RepID=A0A6P4YPS1_BRABE|nr:PREDICTED: collectin-10-like [Branchiostoma belcheri]
MARLGYLGLLSLLQKIALWEWVTRLGYMGLLSLLQKIALWEWVTRLGYMGLLSYPKAGYVRFNGARYKSFTERKTRGEAVQACAADGGTLAMPKNSPTNTFLANLAKVVKSRWIGLTDANKDGHWVFEDGQTLESSGYANWRPGEPKPPNPRGGCAGFWSRGSSWSEQDCNFRRGFICQLSEGV